jgi:hypothetical protein
MWGRLFGMMAPLNTAFAQMLISMLISFDAYFRRDAYMKDGDLE